jgi:hypothetical protein
MLRWIKLIVLASALFVTLTFAGVIALDRFETVEEEYSTHAEALRGGLRTRGWLPDYVPSSAIRIRAAHHLDTNRQWLAFELPPSDLAAVISQGRRVVDLPPSYAPMWLGWWRSGLEHGEDTLLVRLMLPAFPEGGSRQVRCLAADLQERRVFAWSCEAEAAA